MAHDEIRHLFVGQDDRGFFQKQSCWLEKRGMQRYGLAILLWFFQGREWKETYCYTTGGPKNLLSLGKKAALETFRGFVSLSSAVF